uniref:MAT1-1-1 n=1 Tax=Monilinia fructicola TaxID=38448 RepID=A0A2U8RNR3_MONFR|nr:MAT1-1-1 [Monilinia fructicola]
MPPTFKTTMAHTRKRQQRQLTDTEYRVSKPAAKCRRLNETINQPVFNNAPYISRTADGAQYIQLTGRQKAWREAPRRSVNSYILFRTFYMILTVLGDIPQKYKSAILSVLWGRDPFQAKWAILARAYTLMRDAGVKRTVAEFLLVACPQIGIISVSSYLTDLNWTFETNEEGTVCLRQISPPDMASFTSHIARTILTDLDIITFCGAQGYLPVATAASIVQGWNRVHPHASMALQGTLPVTQHIASTQNAYGAWEVPKDIIVAPPPKPAFDQPLAYTPPAPAPGAPAPPAGALPPPPPWSTGMMAGYWSHDNGSVDLDPISQWDFDHFNPASIVDAPGTYVTGDASSSSTSKLTTSTIRI